MTTIVGTDPTGGRPVVPAVSERRPLGLHEIALTGGFWGTLQDTNASATLEHCEQWMERLGWIASFDRVAAGTIGPDRPGWPFADSEVYKLMEALAWEHGRTGDPVPDAALRRLTARIAAAQDDDGYLNTCFGHGAQRPRWSDLEEGHELYCVGHLLQAAVARVRTVGEDLLVQVARRAADQVCAEFGPDGRDGICGHPEIEVGLAELGRALDEPRYLAQAALFVERRGHGRLGPHPFGAGYFQDDVRVRDTTVWHGHAVRALYLAAAAVDVAVDTADTDLLTALAHQWETTVARRTYLTGGMGSQHQDEGFGDDWALPPDRAYCETCAGIASIMVSWRLYLATGDPRYADLMERTFYNVVATSPRSDGRAFFYANPLHQRAAASTAVEDEVNARAEGGLRAPWFDVSCCPTNVARTLATWQSYAAVVEDGGVTLLQHAPLAVRATLADGARFDLDVTTAYPSDGAVTVRVVAAPERPVRLALRVPAWAAGATLDDGSVDRYDADRGVAGIGAADPGLPGEPGSGPRAVDPGIVVLRRRFRPGDEVRLVLPLAPRLTWPDARIDAVRGCVAVERGPVVLCLESPDLPGGVPIEDVRIDPAVPPRDVPGTDAVIVRGSVVPGVEGVGLPYGSPARSHPAPGTAPAPAALDLRLVPYHRWAERGPSTMRIWLPRA
jgi:DUF1680 family protein